MIARVRWDRLLPVLGCVAIWLALLYLGEVALMLPA